MRLELLPTRAVYAPGEHVMVEIRGLGQPGTLRLLHLGDAVSEHAVGGDRVVDLGPLPLGGYGVEVAAVGQRARTAVEVARPDAPRQRYGFVTDYHPGRDIAGVLDNVRRLHLTDIQFYDWAYRHADLLGGGEEYYDALQQPISLETVRRLIAGMREAGARALGYAAVYGVGNDEWPHWQDAALLTPTSQPYSLGDFLQLVDPAEPTWLAHLLAELRAAVDEVGFDGFHLDQYGYPKFATRPDGTAVEVAESFATLIAAARASLPQSRLVFNNVNDFPTWRTAGTGQDAVYVEVWPPHTTLAHLADVATRARSAAAARKPVVIAAYQHVYDTASEVEADRATAFTMATLFSHGATQLLCGEADRILVDPYYVRNHRVSSSTADLLRRWYDFAVEHGELLFDAHLCDVTGALTGAYNDDCDVRYDGTPVAEHATGRTVWRRVLAHGTRLVVHLINLTGQDDTEWDAPRKPVDPVSGGVLRVRRAAGGLPRVRVADPDGAPALVDLPVSADADHAVIALPPLALWQLIVIELDTSTRQDSRDL